MATNTGVIVTQKTAEALPLSQQLPIAIAGTCTTGTLTASTPTKIKSLDDATTILGAGGPTDTLPAAVALLQNKYGCGNITVIKGATEDEAGVLAAIPLLVASKPEVVLTPSFNSAAVVTALKTLVDSIRAIAMVNITAATSVADAITARQAVGGTGIDDQRIIVGFPHMKDKDDPTKLEEVALHLAGILANLDNYGQSPLNQPLKEVSDTDVTMSFSYSSATSDNEQITDEGGTTVNKNPDDEYIIWGARNSSYTEDSTDVLTYINAIRARDEITRLIEARAVKFLAEESNFATASLLKESFLDSLATEAAKGAIRPTGSVIFNEDKSDYDVGKLDYTIQFSPWLPIELISASVSISVSVGG
jgi:phage tail sheath protein FI